MVSGTTQLDRRLSVDDDAVVTFNGWDC